MYKNIVEGGQTTDDNMIRRMRIACCITKATNIHSEYVLVILVPFPRQQWVRERASMLRLYAHYLSCFFIARSSYSVLTVDPFTLFDGIVTHHEKKQRVWN